MYLIRISKDDRDLIMSRLKADVIQLKKYREKAVEDENERLVSIIDRAIEHRKDIIITLEKEAKDDDG